MKKRILVMAYGHVVFTYQYIEKMCSENHKIIFFDMDGRGRQSAYDDEYNCMNIARCFYLHGANVSVNLLEALLEIMEWGEFDVCHIMYPTVEMCHIVQMCRKSFKQIVVNFWGSDFYQTTMYEQSVQKKLLDCSDVIILPATSMEKPFTERWPDLRERIVTVEFDSSIYRKLKEEESCQGASENCYDKEKQENRIVVVAGHSGTPIDQHEMIISAISRCDRSIMSRIIVVFPMTYGLNEEYESKIRDLLQAAPFESVVLTEYLSDDEICVLRRRTDVMIQAIETDAFSAGLEENLYSQSVVLCGDWLNYPQLREEDNSIIWYSDAEDLSEKFMAVIEHFDIYKKEAVKNRICIEKIREKRKNVMNWSDFYVNDQTQDLPKSDEKSGMWLEPESIAVWKETIEKLRKTDLRKSLYNHVMNQWLRKQIRSEAPICDYLKKNHCREVLLYGAGTLGELVYREIAGKCKLTICDQSNKAGTWYDGAIERPEMIKNSSFDCILITPIHVADEIKKTLEQNQIYGNEVISVAEIINGGMAGI